MRVLTPSPVVLLLTCLAAVFTAHQAFAQGRMIQTVEGFYSPAAATFSSDGRSVYVTNAARTDYGMLAGRGAISRLDVAEDGTLTLAQPRFVEGLNAPLGIAILPTAVGDFPAGTLVVATGGRWTSIDRNTPVTDARERGTGLLFFDPASGARLGAVYLGTGSKVEGALGHAMADPGPVAIDGAGNIFLADVSGLGLDRGTGERDRAGIVRLAASAVIALARDEAPAAGSVGFIRVPEVASGLAWFERDRLLYWVTGPGYGDMAGAVLRLGGGDFGPTGKIETMDKDTAPLVSACVTANGTLLVGQSTGEIATLKRGRGRLKSIRFADRTVFISPGQLAAKTLASGRVLVVVPEMAAGGRPAWRHQIRAFTISGDF